MKSKIEKLVELVGRFVRVADLKRLDDGELARIGDAIINGREILTDDELCQLEFLSFQGQASRYTIRQETRSLNGYEYPAPETEAPEAGTHYYVPDLVYGDCSRSAWKNDKLDNERLKAGLVHLSAESAIEHTVAFIKACGGEI